MSNGAGTETGGASESRRVGVVAVVRRDSRFLVIRRSQTVAAPGWLCFPGGGIEPGESEAEAVVREMLEELGCAARAVRPLWRSVTPWNVELGWWRVDVAGEASPGEGDPARHWRPDPREVAEFGWWTAEELAVRADLLASNHAFLEAWRRGEIGWE